jgi:hypothetical protein
MATNRYFSQKVRSEQRLYEDLIIESLQFYGQDVYYIPREVISKDVIFSDAELSRFDHAYKIEMYIENIEGFDGEQDLFTKFGVEIRNSATFVMARRRFNQEIGSKENGGDPNKYYRPREGDLIHLPLSNSTFEIMRVFDETPFYQLSQLPVFTLSCELFEYNDEDFDTGVAEVDNIENFAAYQYVLTMDSASNGYIINEPVTQTFDDYTISAEVVKWSDSDNKLYLAHVGSTDGLYRQFTTTRQVIQSVLFNEAGEEIVTAATPSLVEELQNIQQNSAGGSNDEIPTFDVSAFEFIDFSESNPFGDPQ